MKSSFLLTMLLSTLISVPALAQAPKKRPVQATKTVKKTSPTKTVTTTTTVSKTEVTEVQKSSFDKFYERLSISYFGVYTSPTLEDWNSSNAAISPEFGDPGKGNGTKGCRKNCDSWAQNVWSQFAFSYDFGAKMKLVVAPRFVTYLGNPKDMSTSAGENRSVVGLEDFLVGFAGVVYSSPDKKFNYWVRPGVRLPTSHFSRNNVNAQYGSLSHQVEVLHNLTYDFNTTWQLGYFHQNRFWIYENRYNNSRHREYMSPYISYTVNEKLKLQAYYEIMFENRRNRPSIDGDGAFYDVVWQNVMLAPAYQVTPTVNVMPYLAAFVNDIPFSSRSMWLGAWISWKIK